MPRDSNTYGTVPGGQKIINKINKSNKQKTLSEFLLACTNIRSLCPNGKKSDLKIHAITDIKADIHIIVDSRLDENGIKKWKKTQKRLFSKYNIHGNFSKDRGVTILVNRGRNLPSGKN